ncbi:MAG: hypothetical protein P8Z36_11870 [Gemmatimonadota bacterium]
MRRVDPVSTTGSDRDAPGRARAVLGTLVATNRRAFWIVFLLAFGLRAYTLTLYPREILLPNTSWETGAIAASLVRGGGFADPFLVATGPTAHAPPVYVFLLALLYRALGFTLFAGIVHWLLVVGAYSVMYGMLPWVGEKVGVGRESGFIGGVAGALFVTWPGEVEGFAGVVLALLMVAFMARWSAAKRRHWEAVLLGLAAGVSLHLQPGLLPVLLGCLVFELWWRRGQGNWSGVALVVLGMAVACVPWAVRNQVVLGEPFFIRDNLGLELYVGNHPGAHADIDVSSRRGSFRHPRTDLVEAELVRALGEPEYNRTKGRAALAWIRQEPGAFARLTGTRAAYLWLGPLHDPLLTGAFSALTLLALAGAWRILPRLTPPQRAALLLPLATYPLIYYVVAYQARYRDPINWILFLLAGAAVWSVFGGGTPRPRVGQPGADAEVHVARK